MKKIIKYFVVTLVACILLPSCTTSKLDTDNLRTMYEKRINKTSIFNKLFFNDQKKKRLVYNNVDIYMNEDAIENKYDVIAYGSYRPFTIPLLRTESGSLKHNLLYKAAKMAYKKKCDAVIIDSKNYFRLIKYRQ